MTTDEMQRKLEEVRAKRKAQREQYIQKEAAKEAIAAGGSNQASDVFPFNELVAGDEVVIRFVADPDQNNQNFWRPRSSRRLQFRAIRQPDGSLTYIDGKTQTYNVFLPAWNIKRNETALDDLEPEYLFSTTEDPIYPLVPYSDPKDGDEMAQEFYRKYKHTNSFIYYGFVVKADTHPEMVGKLYRFNCSKSLHNIISSVMKDEEIEEIVTDLDFGHDFKLCCTKKGDYKSYETGSKFYNKMSPLADNLRKVLEDAHLPEFKTLIYKKPTKEQAELMVAAFRAATGDGVFDASWASAWDKMVAFGWKLDANGFLEPYRNSVLTGGAQPHTEIPVASSVATVVETAPWETPVAAPAPIQANAGTAQIQVAAPVSLPADVAKLVNTAPTPRDLTAQATVELNITNGHPVTQPKEVERVGAPAVAPSAPNLAPVQEPNSMMMASILDMLGGKPQG